MYKLHGFSQSGNTYKVALLLQALEQPWTPVHVPFEAFAGGITRSQEWRDERNEMGEVPILEVGDRKLSQSGAIMVHLAQAHGAFGGQSDEERYEILRWLLFDNHKFTSHFATYRFMKAFAAVEPEPHVSKWLLGRMDNAFGIVEKHLADREFMVGAQPSIADMSLCGYLYFPREESGYDIGARFPAISSWLQRLKRLPGWKPPYELLPGPQLPPRW